LAEKVAIVTGGGSGIGRAVTHGLVEDGYHVLIAGRREDRLVETKIGARDPGKVSVVAADISTAEGVQAVFDSLTSAFGRLDLLFNNAGTGAPPVPIEDVAQPDGSTKPEPTIDVRAVVDAVRYMAALPLDANVPFLTVMANQMPFMGRG